MAIRVFPNDIRLDGHEPWEYRAKTGLVDIDSTFLKDTKLS